jgi:hypothetical protein
MRDTLSPVVHMPLWCRTWAFSSRDLPKANLMIYALDYIVHLNPNEEEINF